MKTYTFRLGCWMLAVLAAVHCSCSDAGSGKEAGRVTIKYWEKWTGFEADAMRAVVDDFNASQNRIFVEFSSVSQIDRRLMLATAGGVPPDVAGIWGKSLPVYAENNALTPLDRLAAEGGVRRDQYIDIFCQICSYRGHLWALPTTPSSLALVWNKKLFREAGLDPEHPPQSLAELDQFNEKLVKRRPDGSLAAVGFLPAEPGWWNEIWGWWFGGELWDGRNAITANSPENVAAFQWIESYPRRFGVHDLLAFRDGFGNFASPQNPFFTGRVAMVLQGPWIYNFIKNFAPPDFEWGVAPFPSVDPARFQNITQVEADVLVIPAGAKHPKEAFEFIKYVNSQKPMEKLCLGQRKFSPLRECSAEFFQKHPNPHIGEFLALAKSPNARFVPQLTVWSLYSNDMTQAFGRVWTEKANAGESLDEVQQHVQQAFDHQQKRWERISEKLTKEWDEP
ncbi:MAG: ABC transporter substrate-binding protein [Verrucomicrobiota bacterium]